MRIIVLFNLKTGVNIATYEEWARERDIPTVRALGSIARFDVYAATGLLMGEGVPPFAYYEMIEVADTDQFGKDVAAEAMQKISAEFRELADNPTFVVLRDLDTGA